MEINSRFYGKELLINNYMHINIKATKIDLTPEIKDYVQKKMDMLNKYLGQIQVINVDFEVAMTTAHHNKGMIYRAEVNMELAGELLRVEKTEKNLFNYLYFGLKDGYTETELLNYIGREKNEQKI